MSNNAAKVAAGKAVVAALDGLNNREIIEVLAATAVAHVASGAREVGLTGVNAVGFTQLGLTLFKATVDEMAAGAASKQ